MDLREKNLVEIAWTMRDTLMPTTEAMLLIANSLDLSYEEVKQVVCPDQGLS